MKKAYKVTLAHAVCDENGRANNGLRGDQTGKEVRFQEWYNRTERWTAVIRAKNSKVRKKIAKNAIAGVRNKNLGYSQNDRLSAYYAVEKYKFDYEKLNVPGNTDCSQMATTCLKYAGIDISKDVYSGNIVSACEKTGKFNIYKDAAHTADYKKLKEGDILVGPGHVAIVANTIYWIQSSVSSSVLVKSSVKAIQTRLNEIAGLSIEVDGVFGSATVNAVKGFQTMHLLTADGVVGKNTAIALGLLYGK